MQKSISKNCLGNCDNQNKIYFYSLNNQNNNGRTEYESEV